MIDIIVERGAGDKQGADIIDPLITSEEVAVLRGRIEIDKEEPVERITVTTRYKLAVRNGDIAEVHDSFFGVSWRGKIISIAHFIVLPNVNTTLAIERPQDY